MYVFTTVLPLPPYRCVLLVQKSCYDVLEFGHVVPSPRVAVPLSVQQPLHTNMYTHHWVVDEKHAPLLEEVSLVWYLAQLALIFGVDSTLRNSRKTPKLSQKLLQSLCSSTFSLTNLSP